MESKYMNHPEGQYGVEESPSYSVRKTNSLSKNYTRRMKPRGVKIEKKRVSVVPLPNKRMTRKMDEMEKKLDTYGEALKILKSYIETKETNHVVAKEKVEYVPIVFGTWQDGVGYVPLVMVRNDAESIDIRMGVVRNGGTIYGQLPGEIYTSVNGNIQFPCIDLDVIATLYKCKKIDFHRYSKILGCIYKNKIHMFYQSETKKIISFIQEALPNIEINIY